MARPRSSQAPDQGKVLLAQQGTTDIYLDPALSERVTVSRHGRWRREPDTEESRRVNLLRQLGYGVINRRLQRLSRLPDPPFRGAGVGTSEVFHIGRTTNLVIDTADKGWRKGLLAAARVTREALARGFTEAEVAEQLAGTRTAIETPPPPPIRAATMRSSAPFSSSCAMTRCPPRPLHRSNA